MSSVIVLHTTEEALCEHAAPKAGLIEEEYTSYSPRSVLPVVSSLLCLVETGEASRDFGPSRLPSQTAQCPPRT